MLKAAGVCLMVGGLAIEGLAAAALSSHRLRQLLPNGSPFPLFSIGGLVFVAGVALLGVGSVISPDAP